jgi:hypothetical protein
MLLAVMFISLSAGAGDQVENNYGATKSLFESQGFLTESAGLDA